MIKFKYIYFTLIFSIIILLVVFGINVFPITGTDSRVFIPPALFFSKGLGFVNPLYDITFIYGLYKNSTEFFQFNYYVPLFPVILGILSKVSPGIKSIFFICSLFSATSLLLYGKTLMKLAPANLSFYQKSLLLCSVTYVATFILPTVGRPENLSGLLALILYIFYNKRVSLNSTIYNIVICLLFSFILSTQIICFYFSLLFFVTFEILNSTNFLKTILANLIRFGAICLLFLGILYFSPCGLANTLNGIKTHGTWALTRSDRSIAQLIYFWLFAPLNFGFLLLFICSAFVYFRYLYLRLSGIPAINKSAVVVVHLLIILGLFKFVFYAAPTIYNATQFILPISLFTISNLVRDCKTLQRNILSGLCLLVFMAGSVILIRWIVLFVDYKKTGKDYDSSSAVINKVLREYKNVRITTALWSLVDYPADIKFFDRNFKKDDIVIIQQVYATDLDNYLKKATIIYDWRAPKNRKIFGLSLSATPQCYGFVVCRFN